MVDQNRVSEHLKKGKPDRKVGYLKMGVMEDLKAKSSE